MKIVYTMCDVIVTNLCDFLMKKIEIEFLKMIKYDNKEE